MFGPSFLRSSVRSFFVPSFLRSFFVSSFTHCFFCSSLSSPLFSSLLSFLSLTRLLSLRLAWIIFTHHWFQFSQKPFTPLLRWSIRPESSFRIKLFVYLSYRRSRSRSPRRRRRRWALCIQLYLVGDLISLWSSLATYKITFELKKTKKIVVS